MNLASILGTQHDITAPPSGPTYLLWSFQRSCMSACQPYVVASSTMTSSPPVAGFSMMTMCHMPSHLLRSQIEFGRSTTDDYDDDDGEPTEANTHSTPGPGSSEPRSFPLVGSDARHDASPLRPLCRLTWQGDGRLVPSMMVAVTRARGEGLSSAAMRGLGGPAPPTRRGYSRGESGASTAGGTSPSVRLPPPPPCSDEASTGLRLRGGGLTRHIERTRDRSASDGCTIPFLAYLLGMVLIKSHGPIIHLLLHVRFHPVE